MLCRNTRSDCVADQRGRQARSRVGEEFSECDVDVFDDLLSPGLSGDEVAGLLVDRGGSGDGVADSSGYGLTDGAGVRPVGERVLGLGGDCGLVDVGDLDFDGFAEFTCAVRDGGGESCYSSAQTAENECGGAGEEGARTGADGGSGETARYPANSGDEDAAQSEADVSADGPADQCSSDGERGREADSSGGGTADLGGGVAAGFVDGDAEGVPAGGDSGFDDGGGVVGPF